MASCQESRELRFLAKNDLRDFLLIEKMLCKLEGSTNENNASFFLAANRILYLSNAHRHRAPILENVRLKSTNVALILDLSLIRSS